MYESLGARVHGTLCTPGCCGTDSDRFYAVATVQHAINKTCRSRCTARGSHKLRLNWRSRGISEMITFFRHRWSRYTPHYCRKHFYYDYNCYRTLCTGPPMCLTWTRTCDAETVLFFSIVVFVIAVVKLLTQQLVHRSTKRAVHYRVEMGLIVH
jgi:hypothetical protein